MPQGPSAAPQDRRLSTIPARQPRASAPPAYRRASPASLEPAAPARLVPAMQAMLGGKPAGLTPAAAALVSSTTSDPAVLRKALEALEGAFDSHKDGTILKG